MFIKYLKYQLIQKEPEIALQYYEFVQHHLKKTPSNLWKRIKKIIELNKNAKSESAEYLFENFNVKMDELVNDLLKYDIISFDVFDTLLFRRFDRPVDVFLYMESKYNFANFYKIRVEAEKTERKISGFKEIDIYDIYKRIQIGCPLDINEWVEREINTEKEVCFANPYMLEVYRRLKEAGKIVIAVSDMYIPENRLREILDLNGYEGMDKVFVSCDYKRGKSDGTLYQLIESVMGKTADSFKHVGDNYHSDVDMARHMKWHALYYPNVNKKNVYGEEMSPLIGGVYRGITNAYLRSGNHDYTNFFQYGFMVGGILTYGYCQWIEQYTKYYEIEKILFIARDGFIIKEIYDSYFSNLASEYVLFSRFCAWQILFEQDIDGYIDQALAPRVYASNKKTVKSVIEELKLDFLLPYLAQNQIFADTILDEDIYINIKQSIYKNKDLIVSEFSKVKEGIFEYYRPIVDGVKRLLIVDLGWSGTCSRGLSSLLTEKMQGKIEIFSVLLGTANNYSVDAKLANEKLDAYVFSTRKNRSILKQHMNEHMVVNNVLIETLFTATQPSFLTFCRNQSGDYEPLFGYKEEGNEACIREIQSGIKAFVKEWNNIPGELKDLLNIDGGDAYAPAMKFLENKYLCYNILGDYEVNELSGEFSKQTISTIGELMKRHHCI